MQYGWFPGNTQGTTPAATPRGRRCCRPTRPSAPTPSTPARTPATPGTTASSSRPQKRFSQGYTIMGSYTFSKWMQAINLLNPADPLPIHEISDADAPHRFNISGVWELPFGKGKPLLSRLQRGRLPAGGRLAGLGHLEPAERLPAGLGQQHLLRRPVQHPVALGSAHARDTGSTSPASKPPLPSNCSATSSGRGRSASPTLRRQRQNNVDLALIKDTRITEGKNIQFRAEALERR